jgi:hypothetical protein
VSLPETVGDELELRDRLTDPQQRVVAERGRDRDERDDDARRVRESLELEARLSRCPAETQEHGYGAYGDRDQEQCVVEPAERAERLALRLLTKQSWRVESARNDGENDERDGGVRDDSPAGRGDSPTGKSRNRKVNTPIRPPRVEAMNAAKSPAGR